MKLHRPWDILIIFSSSVYQKKNLTIILASGKTWYIKTLHLMFQNGNFCGLFTFLFVTENRCKVVVFSFTII